MSAVISYNTLKSHIGTLLKAGAWFPIDQGRIYMFAGATEDHQYIHIDEARAKETGLGGTIAHGFLSLSLLPKLSEQVMPVPDNMVMAINYGFNKVRFLNMVRPGDEVRLVATVSNVEEKTGDRVLLAMDCIVEIKGKDKPAIACEWLNLFICEGSI
ncbi:MAG: hypothetical protein COB36_14585 [Alphaproteobacteria bacterium]|nr:MAG: hypothetical protein COB36_14585 [Alphaproteobacteria bacterium]